MYMSVLILNREQVKQVISMKEVIQEVREVYRLKSQGKSVIWPLVNYEFVDEHAAMDIRSGYIKGVQLHGLKMLNNFPENREKGLPPFNGIMMVYDSNTGIPVSVMDASYVTCMRTGAAGALGVDLLARKDAKHLFILGAGKQAPFQIAATLLLRPAIDKVYIADPMFPDNAVQFAAHIAQQLSDDFGIDASGVEFLPALDLAAAVGDSDAIITRAPSSRAPPSTPTTVPSASAWARWSCPSSRASSVPTTSPARSVTSSTARSPAAPATRRPPSSTPPACTFWIWPPPR